MRTDGSARYSASAASRSSPWWSNRSRSRSVEKPNTSANCSGANVRMSSCTRGTLRGDVERQELEPTGHHHRAVPVGVVSVEQVEPGVGTRAEPAEHQREPAAGLLVLPGARQVHRDVDAVDQRRGATGLERRPEVLDAAPEQLEVEVRRAHPLVLLGDGVAALDASQVPRLTARSGLLVAHGQPGAGEARVVHTAGPLLTPQVVDHRHRRDGRQVRVAGSPRRTAG